MNDKYRRFGRIIVEMLGVEAVDSDLNSVVTDPRNARYRVPLPDINEEQNARGMADIIYCAVLDNSKNEELDDDAVYEQCLVDARRMLLDPGYQRLLDFIGDLSDQEHAPLKARQRFVAAMHGLTDEQVDRLFPLVAPVTSVST